jgi:hypothetical protein
MSSTRKTPEHLRPACNSRGEAVEAVEAAEAAEAVEAAGAAAAAAVCRRELAAGARLDLPIRAPSVGRSPSELTLEQRPRSVRDDVLSGRELHLGHWSDISQNARQRCSLELILLLRLVADRNV